MLLFTILVKETGISLDILLKTIGYAFLVVKRFLFYPK